MTKPRARRIGPVATVETVATKTMTTTAMIAVATKAFYLTKGLSRHNPCLPYEETVERNEEC